MMETYEGEIKTLPDNGIFVFGSNTQGRHGKGAAKVAKDKFGAIYGKASGLQGQSYAIITKDLTKNKHPSIDVFTIIAQVYKLYLFAEQNKDKKFYIAYRGNSCNLNAYSNSGMAMMFSIRGDAKIPNNIIFEDEFFKLISQ